MKNFKYSCEQVADKIKQEAADKIKAFTDTNGRKPRLVTIMVGDNGASEAYVRNKRKACEKAGIDFVLLKYGENVTEECIINAIQAYNKDLNTDGIIVQLPLPKHLDERKVTNLISDKKDVDGFTYLNFGKVAQGDGGVIPATPRGIMRFLHENEIEIEGKNCVVIGRSNIVGKPIANLLCKANGTVTICHSKTKDLAEITKKADILIVAVGVRKFINGKMVKKGAVVIDVGINRNNSNRLCGDCDSSDIRRKTQLITPVPKGVGVLTVASLIDNLTQLI